MTKKMIGLLLCLGSVAVVAGGWAYAHSGETSTDNAYVRGDVTSLAPKVLGYVTAVEVQDNQTVQAGGVESTIGTTGRGSRRQQPILHAGPVFTGHENGMSRWPWTQFVSSC
jgi:hypothetical protein